jgi:hypothetical protein
VPQHVQTHLKLAGLDVTAGPVLGAVIALTGHHPLGGGTHDVADQIAHAGSRWLVSFSSLATVVHESPVGPAAARDVMAGSRWD